MFIRKRKRRIDEMNDSNNDFGDCNFLKMLESENIEITDEMRRVLGPNKNKKQKHNELKSKSSSHPTAVAIESFLDTFCDDLPHLPKVPDKYENNHKLKRKFWRALICCFPRRYGAMTVINSSSKFVPGHFTTIEQKHAWTSMKNILKKVHASTTSLRNELGLRGDKKRVQIQRPMSGRSLLSITTSLSSKYGNSLRALVVAAIHPVLGIPGYKVKKISESTFFQLPQVLQDKLPKLKKSDNIIDVQIDATKMNEFITQIFIARQTACLFEDIDCKDFDFSDTESDNDDDFYLFIKRLNLHTESNWVRFGLPTQFKHKYRFVVKVPYVNPGSQCILWSTFHATAGSETKNNEPKITAFVDLVTSENLSEENIEYYKYRCQYSPVDPGGGTGRGSWQSFRNLVINKVDDFGLGPDLMSKFQRKKEDIDEIIQKNKNNNKKKFKLSKDQINQFRSQGYLVVDIPQNLNTQVAPVKESMNNFSKFVQNITGDSNFDVLDTESIEASVNRKLSKERTGDEFFYYTEDSRR